MLLTLLLAAITGVQFEPEPIAYPAFIPLVYGVQSFESDSGGWWRRSFTAQEDGTNLYIYQ